MGRYRLSVGNPTVDEVGPPNSFTLEVKPHMGYYPHVCIIHLLLFMLVKQLERQAILRYGYTQKLTLGGGLD